MSITVDIQTSGPLALTTRQWNEVMREALRDVGVLWHRFQRPKRFSEAGGREYRFQRRSPAYRKAKQRIWHHQRPLTWSGDARRRSAVLRVTARSTSTRGQSMKVAGPRKLNFRPKTNKGRRPPNMAEEFRATSARDRAQQQKWLKQRLIQRLRRKGQTTRVQARITAGSI